MNTEQFGEILQMVGQAGEGAFALAVVYMVVGFVKSFIGPAAFIVFVVTVAKLVRYVVDKFTGADRMLAKLNWYKSEYPALAWDNARKAFSVEKE